jgi:hypothetical protein
MITGNSRVTAGREPHSVQFPGRREVLDPGQARYG